MLYLIISVSELNKVDFNQILENSAETLRTSVDEKKALIKWDSQEPDFIDSLDFKDGPYSHEEILNIMNTEEWQKLAPKEV